MTQIRAARADEWEAIKQLLASASLPTDDLTPASISMFSVYENDSRIGGAIAIESRGQDGLLRSLVVAPSSRHAGIGRSLVAHAEGAARAQGFRALYLLTDSAAEFFAHCGYEKRERAVAPESIRTHAQFSSLCPASAAFMYKEFRT